MGYTTEFQGSWKLNKKLHPKLHEFLNKLGETRRMKRRVSRIYGVEGEFWVYSEEFCGQDFDNPNIPNGSSSEPPCTQPGLWCQWIPNKQGTAILWDGNEKFYQYQDWITYIVNKILAPNGYILNGIVTWQGESDDDKGSITIKDNIITITGG